MLKISNHAKNLRGGGLGRNSDFHTFWLWRTTVPHTHIQWTSVRYQCLGMDKCYSLVEKNFKNLKAFFALFSLFSVFFDKNRKFRFWSYLPTDVSFHLSHQPGWSDEYGVRSFKSCKKSFEKKYFRIFGKSPKSRQNFWIFFLPFNSIHPYQDIDTSLKFTGYVCEAQ